MKKNRYTITEIGNMQNTFTGILQRIGWTFTEYSKILDRPPTYISRLLNNPNRRYISIKDLIRLRMEVDSYFGKGFFDDELHYYLLEKKENLRNGKKFEEMTNVIENLENKIEKLQKSINDMD